MHFINAIYGCSYVGSFCAVCDALLCSLIVGARLRPLPVAGPEPARGWGGGGGVGAVCRRWMATLEEMHRAGGPPKRKLLRNRAMDGRPFMKGVVLRTLIKKPKKPNSANRKCVRVRLSNKREVTAYVPGEGHNLQEHHVVLVRGGRMQDLPGVKHKCVRGVYDLAHVRK